MKKRKERSQQKLIFKHWMLLDTILIFCFPCLVLFLTNSVFVIIILIFLGCFWFGFSIRTLCIYDQEIRIFFPLRFKLFFLKREKIIPYSDIKEIILYHGRVEEVRIILSNEYNILKKERYFFFWLDIRADKREKLLSFFREKDIKVIIKPKHLIS